MRPPLLIALALVPLAPALAQPFPPARVSYADFRTLVQEAEPHRAERLLDLDAFLRMAAMPGAVVLDTRSALRYGRAHLRGAVNVSFPDFTQAALGEVIPTLDTVVLIYCNNNVAGDEVDFPTKAVIPGGRDALAAQLAEQERPLMLALNVPTYITLYGYGYRNVFELAELVHVDDPRLAFDGTATAHGRLSARGE